MAYKQKSSGLPFKELGSSPAKQVKEGNMIMDFIRSKSGNKKKKPLVSADDMKKRDKDIVKKKTPAKGGMGLIGSSNNLMSDKTRKTINKYHPVMAAGRGAKSIVKGTAKAAKSTDKALKTEGKKHLKNKATSNFSKPGNKL